MYHLTKHDYNRIMITTITTVPQNWKTHFKEQTIPACTEMNGENSCFLTLKDNKDNSANCPIPCLINQAKNGLEKISMVALAKLIQISLED